MWLWLKNKKHRYQRSRHLKSSCSPQGMKKNPFLSSSCFTQRCGSDSRVAALLHSLSEFKWYSSRHLWPSHVPLYPHLKVQVTQTSSVLETRRLSTSLIHVLPPHSYTGWKMCAACPGTLCTRGAPWTSWTVPQRAEHAMSASIPVDILKGTGGEDSEATKTWQLGSVSPLTLPGSMRAHSARHQTPQTFAI